MLIFFFCHHHYMVYRKCWTYVAPMLGMLDFSLMQKRQNVYYFMLDTQQRDTYEFNLSLNGDKLKWFRDVTHLGHHFNCCLSFAKDVNSRKSQFIQSVNEINTEFAFAICKAKLLQIYGTSFYGSNLWDFYTKEFSSVRKTWNVAIRWIFTSADSLSYCLQAMSI